MFRLSIVLTAFMTSGLVKQHASCRFMELISDNGREVEHQLLAQAVQSLAG